MRVVVLGAGESGVGAALLAKKQGAAVFISDSGTIESGRKKEMTDHQIPFEEKGHHFENLERADVIVKSPGIPDSAEVIQYLQNTGHNIISEIEFGFQFCNGRILGITGSNGKTTTTRLCFHIMQHAGMDVCMAGNVGTSFCRVLAEKPEAHWYVLELSSFQLDGIRTFRPDIGILLNITPDHLDRYGYSMERYGAAKFRIARNMRPDDLLVYNRTDPWTMRLFPKDALVSRMISVGPEMIAQPRQIRLGEQGMRMPERILQGRHNQMNLACAAIATREAGVALDQVEASLKTFRNVPHRMEYVGEWHGVAYINDSKATNVDAVYSALESMTRPVIWIAGGQDKGNDYSALKALVAEKVRALVCLGIDNTKLILAFSTEVDKIQETTTVYEAVRLAASYARPGDAVLLSPACASFDLFRNYAERGDAYKAAVRSIYGEKL